MGVHYYIIPITTSDFTHTLHNMTFFQNTLRIHGRILWHISVTTDDFITNTGHCRRLYTRFTQLYVDPRNTLKIHGRVLWHEPVTTDGFINASHYYWAPVDQRRYLIQHPRPCFAHRPDSSSVFTEGLGLTQYNRSINIRLICDCIMPAYRARYDIIVLSCFVNTLSPLWNILHNNINQSRFLHIYTRKVLLPHS